MVYEGCTGVSTCGGADVGKTLALAGYSEELSFLQDRDGALAIFVPSSGQHTISMVSP